MLCTTVKHFGAVGMRRLQVYQGGRVSFLAVGVGDHVFACKFMFFCFVCLLSPCALSKTTSGQNAVNILLKLRKSLQDAF